MRMTSLIKRLIPAEFQPPTDLGRRLLARTGYYRARTWVAAAGERVPGHGLYRPLYCPWDGEPAFGRVYRAVAPHTLVSRDRCHVLWQTLRQAARLGGDLIECGVFRGGTALLAALTLRDALGPTAPASAGPTLHLVDSFVGMPDAPAGHDRFERGDLSRTSADAVRRLLADFPFVRLHEGFIPGIFPAVGSDRFAWAHVDVDMGQSVSDCVEFVYPRMADGGVIVFDDYGFPSCTRAKRAVDEAFASRPEVPLYLPTGQCLVVKMPRPAEGGAA